MLAKHGHTVHLYTSETYNPAYDKELPCFVHHTLPVTPLDDYQSETELTKEHDVFSTDLKEFLIEDFKEKRIEIAFTHDWIFTGWNLPYSLGIRKANPHLHSVRWFHWIHSVPSDGKDWWDFKRYGANHKIVFPNSTEVQRVAELFQTLPTNVRIIPHIKDARTWYDFDSETCRFIDDFPGIMQADITCIYPASTDRLTAKKVDVVTTIMSHMKKRGLTVFLGIANQWADGKGRKEAIAQFNAFAHSCGMLPGEDFVFTSEWDMKYEPGLPHRMLRELQQLTNLFVFPTQEESFGLVGPEAALAGCFMVLNKSLTMMYEVFSHTGIYFDFGSHHNILNLENMGTSPDKYYYDVSAIITARMALNESIQTKTIVRKKYNYDSMYLHVYEPLLYESLLWHQMAVGGGRR
jgi:hypothetical protein